ncbi:hypothetical protein ACI2OX_03545 [Bacillus sp. N9]
MKSWDNFKILFQLYYFDIKEKVHDELSEIHRAIRRIDELKEFDFVKDKILNGFNWNQHFGGSRCWLAVYEASHENHRTAPQYFVAIDEKGVEYGLHFGSDHSRKGVGIQEEIRNIDEFTYERFYQKMVNVAEELNKEDVKGKSDAHFDQEETISTETWLELLQNDAIFRETDLAYLNKMYELGGEATATELARELGKTASSFTPPVVALAKRILEATGEEPIQRADGTICYWCTLFHGEYVENNHFKWKLKSNLKEAIALLFEASEEPELSAYGKEDFLEEVFFNEKTYDTISNLLRYKKNIILQGPPELVKHSFQND